MSVHYEMLDLSRSEKEVLVSIAENPLADYHTLYESIGMNKSTFSAIRKRLHNKQIYRVLNMPSCPRMHFELLHVVFGPLKVDPWHLPETTVSQFKDIPESVYAVGDSKLQGIAVFVSEDFTEFDRAMPSVMGVFMDTNSQSPNRLHTHVFPFRTTRFYSFFNFTPLITRALSKDWENETKGKSLMPASLHPCGHVCDHDPRRIIKLRDIERRVFVGLVSHPGMNDSQLSKIIDISRQTISKVKRNLFSNGFLLPRVEPDLSAIGMRLLVLTRLRLTSAKSPRSNAQPIIDQLLKTTPFLMVQKNQEVLHLTAYKDFEDYESLNKKLYGLLRENRLPEPQLRMLAVPRTIALKEVTFGGIVTKTLGNDSEDALIRRSKQCYEPDPSPMLNETSEIG